MLCRLLSDIPVLFTGLQGGHKTEHRLRDKKHTVQTIRTLSRHDRHSASVSIFGFIPHRQKENDTVKKQHTFVDT